MKTWQNRVAIVLATVLLLTIACWIELYPSTSDPKNIEYVLWKRHLFPLNIDTALGTMIGDASRNELVIGKTETQLRGRFGYLLPVSEVSQYLRGCYEEYWNGKRVVFLRDSPWMVVLEGDRATELVLIKGC
jgi:hypothetical protein